jgi:predicted transcriptional regulator YheO
MAKLINRLLELFMQGVKRKRVAGAPPQEAVTAERAAVINALRPIVPMLAAMAGPHLEVVLHDVSKPENSVVAIANGHISGRSVGSSVLEGPQNDKGFEAATKLKSSEGAVHSLVEDYVTVTASGRQLKSASAIFRDSSGEPFATLCLNADMSGFQAAHGWLERMLKPLAQQAMAPAAAATVTPAAEPQMDTLMQEIIDAAVPVPGGTAASMKRTDKIQAVGEMQRRGLFIVKGGVERAAAALNVSRFTIYNYMEQLRRREDTGQGS